MTRVAARARGARRLALVLTAASVVFVTGALVGLALSGTGQPAQASVWLRGRRT